MNNVQMRDLVVSRVLDAPVERIWSAWTDPEHVMRWWGPQGFTSPSAKMDFREGGTSLVCMRAPREFGGQDMFNTWAYTKIVPMQSIEFIQNLADKDGNKVDPVTMGLPPDFPRDQRNLVTFKAAGGNKTEMTVTHTNGRLVKCWPSPKPAGTRASIKWQQTLQRLRPAQRRMVSRPEN